MKSYTIFPTHYLFELEIPKYNSKTKHRIDVMTNKQFMETYVHKPLLPDALSGVGTGAGTAGECVIMLAVGEGAAATELNGAARLSGSVRERLFSTSLAHADASMF